MKKRWTVAIVAAVMACGLVAMTACEKTVPYRARNTQEEILTELSAYTADVGILDSVTAHYLLRAKSDLASTLTVAEGITFEKELFGVAFRKGGEGTDYNYLCALVNEALLSLGTEYGNLAERYNLSENQIALAYTATYPERMGAADLADFEEVRQNGKIVIGYTPYAPMALCSDDGEIVGGFDYDLAQKAIDFINAKEGAELAIEWKPILRSEAEAAMAAKTVDCIWNGLTITSARADRWDFSIPYLKNEQCVMIRKADRYKYKTEESLRQAKTMAAEKGSAGERIVQGLLGIE